MSRRTNDRGQILVLVAGSMVALGLIVGLVIDGGFAWEKRREAQNAADFAALAGTRLVGASLQGTVVHNSDVYAALVRVAAANNNATLPNLGTAGGPVYVDGSGTDISGGTITDDGNAIPAAARGVRVPSAQTTWRPVFLGLMGVSSWSAGAGATARTTVGAQPICVFCVIGTSPPFTMQGGQTSLTVAGGAIGSNAGLDCSANATLSSTGTGSGIATYGSHLPGNCSITPGRTPLTGAIPDPLAFLADPALPGGSPTPAFELKGNDGPRTLNPGIFQGVTVKASGQLTLNPGTYYFTGPLDLQNGNVSGTGVTLVFMGPQTSLLQQANGNLNIAAPAPTTPVSAAYPFPGMAIYFARDNKGTLQLQSSSTTSVTGTIYAVNSAALLDMQSGTTFGTLNSMVVVGSTNMQASSKLSVNYSASQNVQMRGGPAQLVK
jgi:hypothetical protein